VPSFALPSQAVPKKKKKGPAYTADFHFFWEKAIKIVSNPGNKSQAQKAWTKHKSEFPLPNPQYPQSSIGTFVVDGLVTQLERQDKERKARALSGGFVPHWVHLSTWLNNRGWEDVYQVEQQPEKLTQRERSLKALEADIARRKAEEQEQRLKVDGKAEFK
jgi:hypothetical protein